MRRFRSLRHQRERHGKDIQVRRVKCETFCQEEEEE